MRPNEVVELALRRAYAQEAKNVVDTVASVCDALQACLDHQSYKRSLSSEAQAVKWVRKMQALADALTEEMWTLVCADRNENIWTIEGLAYDQTIADALGYLILYHAGQ